MHRGSNSSEDSGADSVRKHREGTPWSTCDAEAFCPHSFFFFFLKIFWLHHAAFGILVP